MDKKTLEEKFEEFARWYVLPLDKSEDGIYRALETQSAWAACQHQQAKVEELQKRVDSALQEIKGAARWINEDAIDDPDFIKGGALTALRRLEQALKGEGATNLNIDEKGECRHFSTTMFHEGKAECFHCDAVVNEEREVIGKQSKGFSWTGKEHEK